MAQNLFDRAIIWCTWLALAVSLATGLVVALTASAGPEVGIGLALVFMVLLIFVSVPLHLGLAVASVVRGIQRGPRPMAWVYAYLLVTIVCHAAVAARMDAFDSLEDDFADWQRQAEQPA